MNYELLKARLIAAAPGERDLIKGVLGLFERQRSQLEEAALRLRHANGDLETRSKETDEWREPTSDAAWAHDLSMNIEGLLANMEENEIMVDAIEAELQVPWEDVDSWFSWAEAFAIFSKYPGQKEKIQNNRRIVSKSSLQPRPQTEQVRIVWPARCNEGGILAGPDTATVASDDAHRLRELGWAPMGASGFYRAT